MTPSPFEIRRAGVGDIPGIVACLRAAFAPYRERYTEGAYEDTVPSPDAVVARLATMAGHIRGMAVLPQVQGSGVAAKLLEAVENELCDRGFATVTLDTTAPLARAIRFYERRGYRASGKVMDFFGMPLHEYVKPPGGNR